MRSGSFYFTWRAYARVRWGARRSRQHYPGPGCRSRNSSGRASILEIIGAWLHIWTPPRDAYVPPIPWRKLAIGAGIGAVVLGAVLAVMVPRINEGKESRAAIERAKDERNAARNRARINHVQRPQRADAGALLPAADAGPGSRR